MAVIHLLGKNTIDKIAAGEVVDRPYSVVKELTENAIDAGADAISVEIKEGGISFIRVTDNGSGIEKSEIKKAFLRHATSKIEKEEDLYHIHSLGFRGEALSSIAAVAQVELITKTREQLTGIRYQIEGGEELCVEEIGAPNGTTILIRNLFYNTPARRKFLRLPQTEGSYVSDLMEHLAVSRPDISFKFMINGQIHFHTNGNGNLKEVLYRIYGKDITDSLIPYQQTADGIAIHGYLGEPVINRANRNFEIVFINGRYIRSQILIKAIEEGYRSYLMQHKFPFCVLAFELDPEKIDVNVHPSKMEVRIGNSNELYELLRNGIEQRLKEFELIPKVSMVEEEKAAYTTQKTPEPFEANRIQGDTAPESSNVNNSSKVMQLLSKAGNAKIIGQDSKEPDRDKIHGNIIKAQEHILVEKPVQMDLFEEKFLDVKAKEQYRILGQIFDTYWLILFQDKLFIMDQHAAHEKVKYERLLKGMEEKNYSTQMISPPVILQLTGKEEQIMQEYNACFRNIGFEWEEFGSGAYAIRGVPVDLFGCDEQELFHDILDELCENPLRDKPEVILQKVASMACKSAVKGNNSMHEAEVKCLLDELMTLENPYNCPHGRPTIISMSKYEIEKKFKRVVT